jgi:6-pyruvoyltetrahydropterin/6-carboxytetrahydropterin synthase
MGFVADFFDIEKCFAGIVDTLDHRCLNDRDWRTRPPRILRYGYGTD